MRYTPAIIFLTCIFLEKIEAENIESGSGDFEILESRDYNYEPNDGHNNDNNNDFDNNDEPYGDNNNGNMDPILILLLFSLNFAAVFLLIRCAIYECHPASYFGTWKKKFPFKADLIQYPTRYELKGTQPTLVRKPLTTSISFEICSKMFDKLTLRGCDLRLPNNFRELTIIFPKQCYKEWADENSSSPNTMNFDQTKIVDEQNNRLASPVYGTKVTTDSWGMKFRNYSVSWDNDVLRCFFQGREVLTMSDLTRYFSTPKGQMFSPMGIPVQNQAGVNPWMNPVAPEASPTITPMMASMMAPVTAPVASNLMITDIFATSSHQFDPEQPICLLGCEKFCFGNIHTSKWGFKTETQFV